MTDRHNESIYGYTDSGIETITRNYNRDGIEMSRTQTTSAQNSFYATLNYNETFGKRHDIGVIIGSQTEDYSNKNIFARRANPPKEGLTQVNSGTSGIRGEGTMTGVRMFSYFGRFNYAYADKYLFEANLRADASSRFKKDNRWGYFPGFSIGWRIAEEEFIKRLDVLSNLKLRASWGQLGNQSISSFWPYLTIIDQNNGLSYSYNDSFSPGAAVTSLVDEGITWETASTLDIGLDVGLLNNRLNIEADYFYKKTSDIIVQLPIPLILGSISPPYENVGEMVNKGFELIVNYGNRTKSNDKFGYNVGVNFTYINNKVTKFRGGKSPDQLYLIREGHSYQSLYGYKVTGIYQTDEEAVQHMHSNSYKPEAGDLKFEDVNQDGKLGFEDKQNLGNTIPKVTYGVTTNFNYKNFDLNLLFQGVGGTYLYNQNQYTRMELETLTIVDSWRDAWTPENTNTNIPSLKLNHTWTNTENSFWVKRADFLKLKNIQLGYLVPQSIAPKLKLEKLYLYANVQSVFTIMMHKGFEGFDPERNSSGNGGALYPTPRIFTFGINFNF
jgi:TonB-linked SusC/RagA family outer membrane protein